MEILMLAALAINYLFVVICLVLAIFKRLDFIGFISLWLPGWLFLSVILASAGALVWVLRRPAFPKIQIDGQIEDETSMLQEMLKQPPAQESEGL